MKENIQSGYPLLFEKNGKFYQLPRKELMEKLLYNMDASAVNVNDLLLDSREMSREDIRKSISIMEDAELVESEKKRFDQYVENYDLKPHFYWADELEVSVKTRKAYVLDGEIKKNEDREKMLIKELEMEGQLTERLVKYFGEHNELGKHWTENEEETIVYDADGNVFEGYPPPVGYTEETKRAKTEYWQYEEIILGPLADSDNIIGIGESSNFQTEIKRNLYIVKYQSGKIFQGSTEQTNIIEKTIYMDGHEQKRRVQGSIISEEMETVNDKKIRRDVDHSLDMPDAFKPLRGSVEYGENGLIIGQDDLKNEVNNAKYMDDSKRREAATYAFAMAEMCERDNNIIEAEKWKNTALNISGNLERYEFVKSKLNNDGTLKLDNNDIINL